MNLERAHDPSQAVVWVHIHRGAGNVTENYQRHFRRIPVAGEHIALDSNGPFYETRLVVHLGFPEAECDAEIYVVELDGDEPRRKFMRGQ